MSVKETFLDLVSYSTASDETSTTVPSTPGQKVLGAHIVDLMKAMGIADAHMDDLGYVYGTIPATAERNTTVGFIAHMDTYGGVSGENVNPQVIENYDGGDIPLGTSGLTLSPSEFPALLQLRRARPSSPPTAPPCWAATTRPAWRRSSAPPRRSIRGEQAPRRHQAGLHP